MAANDILVENGTAIVWADTTDYSSTVSGLTRTHQIDLTSVGAGAARQGAKADLGAKRAAHMAVLVAVEMATSATKGEVVDYYWSTSPSATAGNANAGEASGADAAYTITDSPERGLIYLGSLYLTTSATTTVLYGCVGVLDTRTCDRYGMPIVINRTAGDAFMTDAVEMYVALVPINEEVA
jgi:hypothetical protein